MVESGVPQGSVLGPILSLVYVDDAARALDCEVAMFVDGMKIWSVIEGPADEDRLKMNLNRLEDWSNRWLMRFNDAKCNILRLGKTARSASTRNYFLGGAALQEGLILKTRTEFERDLLNRAAEYPKLFYGYIRQCTRNKDPIPLLRTAEGEHLTDDRAKADHLSEFCRSVFSSETGFNPSALQSFEDTPIIETVQFTEGMVLTELLRLNESKSPGPDEVPAKILEEFACELSKPLSMLFHTSLETGYLPPYWKSAWITPLYKGGSRVSANNYRPVSLTSICCKIMEKIIKQQLMQFLEQNHLLSDSQHGFCKSGSCVTNLLYCLEHWTRAVDRGDMMHVIYIDFKKAFDSVPHHRLLYKLSRAGVRGKLLMWIRSFLVGRSQAVHVSDQQSAEVAVKSGVPQGSVLGPTLFLVYVNDCANELNCDVAMFADDIKIWSTIRSEVDEARLQTNLDHLGQWSKNWLLPFNVNKCNFLRVGRTSSPNYTVYRLTGKPLDNRLSYLPVEVTQLTKLETLLVSKNMLKTLAPPSSLANFSALTNLRTVDFSFNCLTDFPVELCTSSVPLDHLNLSNNQISVIPTCVEALQAIELNLNENKVDTIAESIARCPRLKVLRLAHNAITLQAFPMSILENSTVSLLVLEGNPLQIKTLQELPAHAKVDTCLIRLARRDFC
nr:unnamed protein product [Spirometra erinaceieuropaei]